MSGPLAWLAIIGVGLGVRLLYLLQAADTPLFAVPLLGAGDYAAGHGPSNLYHVFIGLPGRLPGGAGPPYWWPLLGQAVVGAASCLVLWRLGRQLHSGRIGLIAALLMAVYGPLVFYAGQFQPATLAVVLVLLSVWLILTPSTMAAVLSGLAAGLACLTAASAVVLIPIFCLWRWRHDSPRGAVLLAGTAAIAVAAGLFGGITPPVLDPSTALSPTASAAGLIDFWRGAETATGSNPYLARDASSLLGMMLWHQWLAFPFGLAAPLALVGLGHRYLSSRPAQWQPAQAGWTLLGGLILAWWMSVLVVPVSGAMRLPVVPLILLLACQGAAVLVRRPLRLTPVLAVVALVPGLNVALQPPGDAVRAREYIWRGQAYEQQNMPANALGQYRRALQLQPDLPLAQRGLAGVLVQRGDLAAAGALYTAYLDSMPDDIEARRDLALVLAARGLHEQALTELATAIDLAPARADLHGSRAFVSLLAERPEMAMAAYGQVLALRPDSALVHYQLGRLHESRDQADSALAHYQQAVAGDSMLTDAQVALADLLMTQGDAVGSGDLAGSPAAAQAEGLLRRVVRLDPASLSARWSLGRLLARTGRYAEAIECFETLLELAPGEYEANLYLGGLYRRIGDLQRSATAFSAYETEHRARRLEATLRSESEDLARRFLSEGGLPQAGGRSSQ